MGWYRSSVNGRQLLSKMEGEILRLSFALVWKNRKDISSIGAHRTHVIDINLRQSME